MWPITAELLSGSELSQVFHGLVVGVPHVFVPPLSWSEGTSVFGEVRDLPAQLGFCQCFEGCRGTGPV